jgi:hypothetical protein
VSSLSEFMRDSVNCQELRTKVAEFLVVTKANRIDVFECPVCGEDLRQTYQDFGTGRGNCNCCKLGIQMTHTVNHAEHHLEGGAPCSVDIRYPVSLSDPELISRLRKAWVHMNGTTLVSQKDDGDKADLDLWVQEAVNIMTVYNQSRKPQ